MNTKMIIATTKFEFKLYLRNFMNVFFLLFFPSLMLVTFGLIFGNDPLPEFGGYGVMDTSVPAYAGMIVSVSGIMSLPLALCEYRENKILKRFKLSPMNPFTVIVAQGLINLLLSSVGMILLGVVGKIFFGVKFDGNLLLILAMFLLSTISIFSIGFIIASFAPNSKTAQPIANIIYFPMLFLTGATFPLDLMPDFMQKFALFLPVTHVVKVMRGAWLGHSFSDYSSHILILIGFALVFYTASLKLFKWE